MTQALYKPLVRAKFGLNVNIGYLCDPQHALSLQAWQRLQCKRVLELSRFATTAAPHAKLLKILPARFVDAYSAINETTLKRTYEATC